MQMSRLEKLSHKLIAKKYSSDFEKETNFNRVKEELEYCESVIGEIYEEEGLQIRKCIEQSQQDLPTAFTSSVLGQFRAVCKASSLAVKSGDSFLEHYRYFKKVVKRLLNSDAVTELFGAAI